MKNRLFVLMTSSFSLPPPSLPHHLPSFALFPPSLRYFLSPPSSLSLLTSLIHHRTFFLRCNYSCSSSCIFHPHLFQHLLLYLHLPIYQCQQHCLTTFQCGQVRLAHLWGNGTTEKLSKLSVLTIITFIGRWE